MFFKINFQTNKWIRAASICYLLMLLLSGFLKLYALWLSQSLSYTINILMGLVFVLLITCMINVLLVFEEKIAVTSAFTIFLCIYIIGFWGGLFRTRIFGNTFSMGIGILSSVLNVYVFIQTCMIKSKYIKFAFRLFGFGLFILTLSTYAITIAFPLVVAGNSMNRDALLFLKHIMLAVGMISLLSPISVILIAGGVNKSIVEKSIQTGPAII